MPRVSVDTSVLRRFGAGRKPRRSLKRKPAGRDNGAGLSGAVLSSFSLLIGALLVWSAVSVHTQYTLSLQSPLLVHLQSPLVVSLKTRTENADQARRDQHHPLTAYQQYACQKFGEDCRIALAIQRAENPAGQCEIYHYNIDGTLDWGYFQINTVHQKRPGLNLRDLLDCKANIDFAYHLYREKGGFSPWSTFKSGAYLKNLR